MVALVKLQQPLGMNWKLIQVLTHAAGSPPVSTQVRYRKPRWLVPRRAPSKEGIYFHKPKPTARDEARAELAYKSYNAILRSIAAAFQEEILLKQEKGTKETMAFDEEEHHAKCMAYNDAYNAKMREERGKRLSEIIEEQQLQIMQKEIALEQDLQGKLKEFEKEVETALEENWIDPESIEEKVNEAMDNIVNFNFSVDRDGTIATRTLIP